MLGTEVVITFGPFAGLKATVVKHLPTGRVQVSLTRSKSIIPIELDEDMIEELPSTPRVAHTIQ